MTTATSRHTPGPWEVHEDAIRPRHLITHPDDQVIPFIGEQGRIRADARLIAAAPALLAALEDALHDAMTLHDITCGWTDKARAAIAQAKGE